MRNKQIGIKNCLWVSSTNGINLSKDGAVHYAINSVLYITTLREKYAKMYENFINILRMYSSVKRVLLKGYLPISLLPPKKLKEILNEVKKAIQATETMIYSYKKITFIL